MGLDFFLSKIYFLYFSGENDFLFIFQFFGIYFHIVTLTGSNGGKGLVHQVPEEVQPPLVGQEGRQLRPPHQVLG